ncbi:hypothetical protein ACFFJ4_07610 [Xanthomonas dyei]|nr:hypothetical protein [Xanthomonas dyei]
MNWLERWSGSFPWIFFLFPLLFSKAAVALGIADFCIFPGWKLFYEAVLGSSEGYGLTTTASLLLSPLIMLWLYSTSDVPEIYSRPKAFLAAALIFVLFLGFLLALLFGPPVEAAESSGKGMLLIIKLGRFHILFSLGYGLFVAVCAVFGYCSCAVVWAALNRFNKDGMDL